MSKPPPIAVQLYSLREECATDFAGVLQRVAAMGYEEERMPKGYVILTEAIRDHAGMDAYGQASIPSLIESGGRVLVVDAQPQVLEGEWHGDRTVVVEFESVDAARAWYASSSYQTAMPLRHAASDSNVAILSGFELA